MLGLSACFLTSRGMSCSPSIVLGGEGSRQEWSLLLLLVRNGSHTLRAQWISPSSSELNSSSTWGCLPPVSSSFTFPGPWAKVPMIPGEDSAIPSPSLDQCLI